MRPKTPNGARAMSFRVTCPECDAVHKVDDKYSGRTVVCSECQSRFRAEPDDAAVERRTARPPVVRPASASGSRKSSTSRSSKKKSGPHWAYVAGGSVAGSLILCLVGWNLYLKPAAQPYTHPEMPPFSAAANVAPNNAGRPADPGGIPPRWRRSCRVRERAFARTAPLSRTKAATLKIVQSPRVCRRRPPF